MSQAPLKVGIIGSGKIGASFDSPDDSKVLSHAHGFYNHPGFEIVGFVDSEFDQADQAAKKWGGRAYGDIDSLFLNEEIEIISVCSPTQSHHEIIKKLTAHEEIIGGIIEKPLAGNLEDAKEITQLDYFKRRKFLVNYKRRFLPEYKDAKSMICEGKAGKLISGTIYYCRGLQNNCSHALDLLNYFDIKIEEIQFAQIVNNHGEYLDYDAIISTGAGAKIHLVPISATNYKVFELDLFFERVRIKFGDEGYPIIYSSIQEDKLFSGYMVPVESKIIESSASRVMDFVVNSLYDTIKSNSAVECSLEDGYEAQRLVEKITAAT